MTHDSRSSRSLDRRTTLITGASAGIGRATAELFARHGSNLVLLARRAHLLEELAVSLRAAHGVEAAVIASDLSDVSGLQSKLQSTLERLPVDICIANAGVGQYGPFDAARWEDIRRVLAVNVDGALATAHAVLPGMRERGSGSVVFISSVLGKRAVPWNAVYCASKYALHGLADALRLEAKPFGVHIGIVAPARTSTDFFNAMTYSVPQTRRREVPESPPEAVARAILRNVLHRRRETVATLGGKFYAFIGYHFPRTCDFVFSRVIPAPDRHAHQNTSSPHPL
jgi:short-subunit dehydrogenase